MSLSSLRRGSLWALSGKILSSVSTLLTFSILTRLLTKNEFGHYASLSNLLVLLAALGGWGITSSVVREVASSAEGELQAGVIRVSLVLTFIISGLVSLIAYLTIIIGQMLGFFIGVDRGDWLLLCIWLIFTCLQGTIGEAYRGLNYIGAATLFTGLLATLLALMGLGLLLAMGGTVSLRVVLSVMSIAAGVASLAGLWSMHKTLPVFQFLPSRRIPKQVDIVDPTNVQYSMRKFFKLSTPFLLINVLNFLITQADVLLLTALVPREGVALYAVAARLVLFVVAPLVISNAVLPAQIARLYSEGKIEELERIVRLVSTIAALPAVLALLFLVIGGPELLSLLYGPAYREAYPALLILSFGQVVLVAAGSGTLVLAMTGYQNEILKINALMAVLLLGAGTLAVKLFGFQGMALTMALTWSISQVMTVWRTYALVGIWPHIKFSLLSDLFVRWRTNRTGN